jgi:hypothetical protein
MHKQGMISSVVIILQRHFVINNIRKQLLEALSKGNHIIIQLPTIRPKENKMSTVNFSGSNNHEFVTKFEDVPPLKGPTKNGSLRNTLIIIGVPNQLNPRHIRFVVEFI